MGSHNSRGVRGGEKSRLDGMDRGEVKSRLEGGERGREVTT